ncbi:MAG TPA: acyltransferase [Legionella sp.]|nr:acyltransferase [Legionella sp.]
MTYNKSAQEIEALTSIRFFFALIVVLVHVKLFFPQYRLLPESFAKYAVTGFFMLSGMILTHVYQQQNFSIKGNIYNFYTKRFSRIYPLYILPLLFLIPIKLVESFKPEYIPTGSLNPAQLAYVRDCSWGNFVLQFLGLQSIIAGLSQAPYGWNIPGWSVSTEMGFYLLFPFIIPGINKMPKRPLIALFIILIVIAMVLGYWLSTYPHASQSALISFVYMNPLIRLVEFALGIISYKLCQERKKSSFFLFIFIFFLVVEMFLILVLPQFIFLPVPFHLIVILMYLMVFNPGLMRARILVLLGNSSYSLYLLHFPILLYLLLLSQMKIISITEWNLVLICIGLIFLSILIYLFYEKPLTHYIRKKMIKN